MVIIQLILEKLQSVGVMQANVLPLIGLAASLAGGISSLIGSAKSNARRKSMLNKYEGQRNAWYDKNYYQDVMDRSENQSVLRDIVERLKDTNKQQDKSAAITGATQEAKVAAKSNAQRTYADVVNKMVGRAGERKDRIDQQHQADLRSVFGLKNQAEAERGETWKNLAGNASQLGVNSLMMMGSNSSGSDDVSDSSGSEFDLMGKEVKDTNLIA